MDTPSLSAEAAAAAIRREYETRYSEPRTELVEAGRVRDYLLSMDEPADLDPAKPVPSLYVLTIGRTRRPQPSTGGAVNAGDEYEFFAPVFIGDQITINRRVVDVQQRQGKRGRMFLSIAEAIYRNQHGATVAVAKLNTLRWGW